MADLKYGVQLEWGGTDKGGEGNITMDDAIVRISGPANMGGQGVGASTEELLISAVGSCYSGTLLGLTRRSDLPIQSVRVHAEGVVTDHPAHAKFSRLIVNPTFIGGDPARQTEYEKMAADARERCFIGKTIAGNVAYELGEVHVEK